MRVIVAGASGFIGRELCAQFTKDGAEVFPLMRDTFPSEIPKEADVFINAAGLTIRKSTVDNWDGFMEGNVLLTMELLKIAGEINGLKNFIQISTGEVYGPAEEHPHSEVAPLRGINAYSATKGMCDLGVSGYARDTGIITTIIRPVDIFGQGMPENSFFPRAISAVKRGETVSLFSEGRTRRQWLCVGDLVSAIMFSIVNNLEGIYNLPGAERLSLLESVKLVEKVTGCKANIRFVESPPQRGPDIEYWTSGQKIREAGWLPRTTLDEGLSSLSDTILPF